jgi:uncharacterized protein YnzC (UPF0291/DUF896 family)
MQRPRILITLIPMFLLSAQTLTQTEADVGTRLRAEQIDKYKTAIRDRIKRFIVLPPDQQGNR